MLTIINIDNIFQLISCSSLSVYFFSAASVPFANMSKGCPWFFGMLDLKKALSLLAFQIEWKKISMLTQI